MKIFVFALLLVAVGANVLPQQYFEDEFSAREERIVAGRIKRAIEQLAISIREAGLDPFFIERWEFQESIVPILVTVSAVVDNLQFTGLSNIAIHRIDYGAITNRLQFDISLPQLRLSVGEAGVRANVFGTRYTGQLSGSLKIIQMRLKGTIRVNIGIISGISLRNVDCNFRIDEIESILSVLFQGDDYSDVVNAILNETIPGLLKLHQDEIDRRLSQFILEAGNRALDSSVIAGDGILIE